MGYLTYATINAVSNQLFNIQSVYTIDGLNTSKLLTEPHCQRDE